MDSAKASLDLLAHFDSQSSRQPKAWCVAAGYRYGVPCVLKWAAAVSILAYATCILLQFGYSVAAERALTDAARAAALEATLPRATRASIAAAIERPLTAHRIPADATAVTIRHNGLPLGRSYRLADDDLISVHLSLPASAALPPWIRALNLAPGDALLEATAERQMPGKYVRRAAAR